MTLRDSASRLKNKAKARLSRGKPEPERREVGGGRVGPANSHLQPKPRIGVVERGGNVNPRDGESDSMRNS